MVPALPIPSSCCPVLLHRPAVPSRCSIPLLHPAAPSCLARLPCRSRLLRQVAGLANGNDHVLGLTVTASRHLRHLTHLVDAVADAVDIALVAVVIRVGAEDPVWRRKKHKTSPWLPLSGPRVKAGWQITAPHYILPPTLGVHLQEGLSPTPTPPAPSSPLVLGSLLFPALGWFSGCWFLESLPSLANEITLLIPKMKMQCL